MMNTSLVRVEIRHLQQNFLINIFRTSSSSLLTESIDDYRAAREPQDAATSNLKNPDTTLRATVTSAMSSGDSSQIQDTTSFPPPSDHVTKDFQIWILIIVVVIVRQ
jgi:hypothetical protein